MSSTTPPTSFEFLCDRSTVQSLVYSNQMTSLDWWSKKSLWRKLIVAPIILQKALHNCIICMHPRTVDVFRTANVQPDNSFNNSHQQTEAASVGNISPTTPSQLNPQQWVSNYYQRGAKTLLLLVITLIVTS